MEKLENGSASAANEVSEKTGNSGKAALPYSALSLSRRNAFMWAAMLFALLSFAVRIAYYSPIREGAEGTGSFLFPFFFVVLPGLCYLLFSIDIIFKGEKELYRTSRPVLLFVAFLIARALWLLKEGKNGVTSALVAAALIVLYIVCAVLYRFAVNTGGRRRNIAKRRFLALAALLIALAAEILLVLLPQRTELTVALCFAEASLIMNILAATCVLIGAKKRESEHPMPMAGDRKDGRRIRSLDPMNSVAVYVMTERNTANNLFHDSVEVSKAEAYIRQKREQGLDSFGYTHLFLAAYVRTVSQRPAMNRFISGQKVFSREDRLEIAMAIKKDMSLEASETIVNIILSPEDTAETIYEKFNKEVEAVKASSELDSGFDKFVGLVNYIPGLLLKFTVWFIKLLDYFGLLPNFITKISPFHGSIFVTSMGSLGIPPVYHHLYDFGNIPLFLAFGMKRSENEVQADGSVSRKKYIDFTVNTDERICDGYYYASAFKYFKRCIADPSRLDEPPESVVWDVE
ncbi:MAG: hypothetical protein IKZ82_03000 [Clostridia bacterium]|nr:hypothetical protein [Clostridia bacterium]